MKPDLKNIPKDPGSYLFYNKEGQIIYIGKAKNLRSRVRSYWSKGVELEPAKQHMVSEITRVDYIAVDNETEALLLEAGLIRKHKPKYNIDLKDDRSWIHIVITREAFPRIITARGNRKIKGEYFGPFTKAGAAKTMVKLIHKILPLRTCRRDLSALPNGIVCMQYHLGNCLGPCEKKIREPQYLAFIKQARDILKGHDKNLLRQLKHDMLTSSKQQDYEKAAVIRNKIRALEQLSKPQHIVHPLFADQDIVNIAHGEKKAVITIMQLRNGQLLDTLHYALENRLNLSAQELIEQFVLQYYSRPYVVPKRVSLPTMIAPTVVKALKKIQINYPKRGAKKRMLNLAQKNAWLSYHKKIGTSPLPAELYSLKDKLTLHALPRRIEAYDISNISGSYAVGAMVVAVDGKLTPSNYRKFKIKTVSGANDVRMMQEILIRRQKHSEWPEPQLILLDGGKPQLNAVYKIIKPSWRTRLVALAKKDEELFQPHQRTSIRLSHSDKSLMILMKLRDAVHRQAITYYRKTHMKQWKG